MSSLFQLYTMMTHDCAKRSVPAINESSIDFFTKLIPYELKILMPSVLKPDSPDFTDKAFQDMLKKKGCSRRDRSMIITYIRNHPSVIADMEQKCHIYYSSHLFFISVESYLFYARNWISRISRRDNETFILFLNSCCEQTDQHHIFIVWMMLDGLTTDSRELSDLYLVYINWQNMYGFSPDNRRIFMISFYLHMLYECARNASDPRTAQPIPSQPRASLPRPARKTVKIGNSRRVILLSSDSWTDESAILSSIYSRQMLLLTQNYWYVLEQYEKAEPFIDKELKRRAESILNTCQVIIHFPPGYTQRPQKKALLNKMQTDLQFFDDLLFNLCG